MKLVWHSRPPGYIGLSCEKAKQTLQPTIPLDILVETSHPNITFIVKTRKCSVDSE